MRRTGNFEFYQKQVSRLPFGYRPPPLRISYKVTSRCNLNCRMCAGLEGEDLGLRESKQIIDKIHRAYRFFPFKPTIGLLGGEPFMRKDILEIAEHVVSRGLNCEIVTNGTLVNEAVFQRLVDIGVHELTFSLDGPEKNHDFMRGEGVFRTVLKNIMSFVDIDRENKIQKNINTIVSRSNIQDIEDFIGLFDTRIIRVNLMPLLTRESPRQRALDQMRLTDDIVFYSMVRRLRDKPQVNSDNIFTRRLDKTYEADSDFRCSSINWRCTVYPDGTMRPCIRMPHLDLKRFSFMRLFNHQSVRKRRVFVSALTKPDKLCEGCSALFGCRLIPINAAEFAERGIDA